MKKFAVIADKLYADQNSDGPISALKVFNASRVELGSLATDLTGEIIHRSVRKLLDAMK